jgi:predicted patatin/cPLA2 family phospholipase
MKLVLEGGGVRAAYQAGVLLGLSRANIQPHAVIGSSSGAINAAFFASGQMQTACDLWINHVPSERFISYRRQFTPGAKPALGVDDMLDDVIKAKGILDVERAIHGPVHLYLTATDIDANAGHVARPNTENIYEWLRAAMALPVGYNKLVSIDGMRFIDGGIGSPCPFDAKLDEDYPGPNVVILTRKSMTRKPPPVFWERLAVRTIVPKEARNICLTQHDHHNATMDRLRVAVERGEVLLIEPPDGMPLSRLTRDPKKIRQGVDMGIRQGEALAKRLSSPLPAPLFERQRVHDVVSPRPSDLQIAQRQALFAKPRLREHSPARDVDGHRRSLHAMKLERLECEGEREPHRLGGQPLTLLPSRDPVAQRSVLCRASQDVRDDQAADQLRPMQRLDQERIGAIFSP